MDNFIDIKELSKILCIPEHTIRNRMSDKTWPLLPIRFGRSLRWKVSEVEKFIEDGCPGSSMNLENKL